MDRTPPPARKVPRQLDLLQVLEDLRVRAVDVEAVAHAAAERDPPPALDADGRREARRLVALVAATHVGIEDLIAEIDRVFARAMALGDEMAELTSDEDATDPDPMPIPQ